MPNYVFYLFRTIMLLISIQLFIYAQIYNELFVFLNDFMISLLLNIKNKMYFICFKLA